MPHVSRLIQSLGFFVNFSPCSLFASVIIMRMCRVHVGPCLTTVGGVTNVCPFQKQKDVCVTSSALSNRPAALSGIFPRVCVLLECLSLLELPGSCKATWNDSWIWQMSGTAGCVLDYPKSLDNTVIHHCPNYLCIDCGSLCDSTVMANYPGYLWYLLYNGL